MALCGTAQTVGINFEPQNKGVAKHFRQAFVGSDGQSVVFLQRMGLLGTTEDLASYDLQQHEQARVKFDNVRINNTSEVIIREALVNGSTLDLLLSIRQDDGLHIYHERRDMATLQLIGERQLLAKIEGSKSDELFFFSATSPDGKLVGMAMVRFSSVLDVTVRASLYNRQMDEQYWTMNVPAHGFNEILVTNNGEVVLAGLNIKDRRGVVNMSVSDGEESEKYSFSYDANGILQNSYLTRYADGRVLLVAAMQESSKVIMRVGTNIDCVDAVTFDTRTKQVNVDRHRFTTAELCVMENKKGEKTGYNWMIYGNLAQVVADDEGAFAVVDNRWTTYRKGSLVNGERRGMLVLRIDREGHFVWSHASRTYINMKAAAQNWLDYRWVPTREGIMLAYTTNKKDVFAGPGQAVKGVKNFGTDANLTVVNLNREGKATENHFSIGKQVLMDRAWPLQDGRWLVFVSNSSKGAFGKIEIEN